MKEEKKPRAKSKIIAKKDFIIKHNEFELNIKKGDDLSKVPSKFIANLKTEKVI